MTDPSDHTTVTEVLAGYRHAGYTVDLEPEDTTVRCGGCGASSPADAFEIHSLRRLEGASDPDDEVAVIAAVCPSCGARGVAVVKFGPGVSEAEANLLLNARDVRFESSDLPPAASPDERAWIAPTSSRGSVSSAHRATLTTAPALTPRTPIVVTRVR